MADVGIICLCGKYKSSVHLKDKLPIRVSLCHRSHCRYNLGALSHSTLPCEGRPEGIEHLEAYSIADIQTVRYFCPKCGSHVFETSGSEWKVQSGVVQKIHSEQVFGTLEEVIGHSDVQDTKDGGLSLCFGVQQEIDPAANDEGLNTYQAPSIGTHETELDQLRASCICKGVQFSLTRPNAESAQCSSPWSDLLVPYHKESPENPGDVKWWIRDGGRRWLAGTCACRSCRLGLGSPIQTWAFVSKVNIFNADGTPLSYTAGTLKSFESSPGVRREFCGKCGATIFWHNEGRPGVVDVSVGVLRASEGALARTWLEWWTERVSFAEEALDKRLIQNLEAGLPNLKSMS